MIIFEILKAQELDVCSTGTCTWISPNNTKILVCLSTALACNIQCDTYDVSGQCQGLIVYNWSPSLYIQCDYPESCKNIKVCIIYIH